MWELDDKEDWALKNWVDALELWYWRRLLRVPWIVRVSSQSIWKKINPEESLERRMPKHQYFGHLMQKANSLEKTWMLGNIEDKRRKEQQKMRWLNSITDPVDMNMSKLRETVKGREAWHEAVRGVMKSQTWLNNWTTMNNYSSLERCLSSNHYPWLIQCMIQCWFIWMKKFVVEWLQLYFF